MISQPEPAVSRLLPLDPIPAPMAWRDPDFAIERNWAFRLSPVDIAELGAALPPWWQAANASGSVRYRRPPLLSESQIRRTQSERMNGRALVEESDIAALDVHVQRDLLALRHRVEEIERLAPEGRPPLATFLNSRGGEFGNESAMQQMVRIRREYRNLQRDVTGDWPVRSSCVR